MDASPKEGWQNPAPLPITNIPEKGVTKPREGSVMPDAEYLSINVAHPTVHPVNQPHSPVSEDESIADSRDRNPTRRLSSTIPKSSLLNSLLFQGSGKWRTVRYYYREYLAELVGTYVLVLLGLGVIISVNLNPEAETQKWTLICLGWTLAIMVSLFVAQGVSGGHLNPAVTITFATWRQFPWRKVPGYILMQLLGAFLAAGTLHLLFLQSLHNYSGNRQDVTGQYATAGFFVTFPTPIINHATAFFSEALATAMLVMAVFSVTDRHNVPPIGWGPLALGLAVGSMLMSLTFQAGGALNPARDLGPRLYLLAVGYTSEVFRAYNHYFYVPIVAPIVGGLVGGFAYDSLIISSLYKDA
ncbi:glycerol channel [Dispira parvispora]|uniref:Glycerol channel n=1 Tax=Dispira parvispora TaxID=1520584 RepID=A0A9W8ASQ3_9FUNG|nr:glycerol channel [Dispira parvispora]